MSLPLVTLNIVLLLEDDPSEGGSYLLLKLGHICMKRHELLLDC